METLKRVAKKIELWFDIYFVYFLYNDRKLDRYYNYMRKKWGDKLNQDISKKFRIFVR